MAAFRAIPATVNAIKTSKNNAAMLELGFKDFRNKSFELYAHARGNMIRSPEESVLYYKDLTKYINGNRTALLSNRFVGQGRDIKAAVEMMDLLLGLVDAEMKSVISGAVKADMDRMNIPQLGTGSSAQPSTVPQAASSPSPLPQEPTKPIIIKSDKIKGSVGDKTPEDSQAKNTQAKNEDPETKKEIETKKEPRIFF